MDFDDLSVRVIRRAIEVHRPMGAGLLESTHEPRLAHQRRQNHITFHQQHPQPVHSKDTRLDGGCRMDALVENGWSWNSSVSRRFEVFTKPNG